MESSDEADFSPTAPGPDLADLVPPKLSYTSGDLSSIPESSVTSQLSHLEEEEEDPFSDWQQYIEFFPKLRCSRFRWSGFQLPLRFVDRELEQAFRRDQAEKLGRVVMTMGRVGTPLLAIFSLAYWLLFGVPVQEMQLRHLIELSGRFVALMIGLLMSVRNSFREEEVLVIFASLISLVLLCHCSRSAFLAGQTHHLDLRTPLEASESVSDSFTIAYISLLLGATFLAPIRCTRSACMIPIVAVMYLSFTLPLPAEYCEGGAHWRIWIALHLAAIATSFCAFRASNETKDRVELLKLRMLSAELTKEKVLRVEAEHQVDMGPFSSHWTSERKPVGVTGTKVNGSANATASICSSTISSLAFASECPSSMVALTMASMQKLVEAEQWLISPDDVELSNQILGYGGFGAVLKGNYLRTQVAVKSARASQPGKQKKEPRLPKLAQELRILRRIRHPNIVCFYGACITSDGSEVHLVEELLTGYSMNEMFKNGHVDALAFTAPARCEVLLGICSALAYLHGLLPAIVHGDLKPHNVMLDKDTAKPKLIDFGLSKLQLPRARMVGGTLKWQAPETFRQAEVTSVHPSADMFSFGRLAYFAMTGEVPLKDVAASDIIALAIQRIAPPLSWPESSIILGRDCQGLAQRCMSQVPEERPTSRAVLGELTARLAEPEQPNLSCEGVLLRPELVNWSGASWLN
ncbi:unnamed protein product [Polarella glacialis]|uniref:Protein kinase domain-containing protein n=1 Tax=Polarella glacialis TaxID=89957 RepID=A0A813EDI9_POLGL|nr:unnamed protein product [Polarella glacialis]